MANIHLSSLSEYIINHADAVKNVLEQRRSFIMNILGESGDEDKLGVQGRLRTRSEMCDRDSGVDSTKRKQVLRPSKLK
jgi:hypothetical protein